MVDERRLRKSARDQGIGYLNVQFQRQSKEKTTLLQRNDSETDITSLNSEYSGFDIGVLRKDDPSSYLYLKDVTEIKEYKKTVE